ncbi:hypothetical protein LXL04_000002 [Taraxacum kok-saghyz]
MDSIFGDKISIPPDIGDYSKIDEEMKNNSVPEVESITDDMDDLHGPIKSGKQNANEKKNSFDAKSLRQQRHLNSIEWKKIAKANYEVKLTKKSGNNSGKSIAGFPAIEVNQNEVNTEMINNDDEGRNEEAKRSKLNLEGNVTIPEELRNKWNSKAAAGDESRSANPVFDGNSSNINDIDMTNSKEEGGILLSEEHLKNWKQIRPEEDEVPILNFNETGSNSENVQTGDILNQAPSDGGIQNLGQLFDPMMEPNATIPGNPAHAFIHTFAQMVEKKKSSVDCTIRIH